MDLDLRKILGMIAPLAIVYMTWSSVQGGLSVLNKGISAPAAMAHLAAVTKSAPLTGALRNPFAPLAADEPTQGAMALLQAVTGTAAGDDESEEPPRPYRLSGTVLAGRLRVAIINGQRVNEGDSYQGLRLARIEANRVLLTGHGQTLIVPLELTTSGQASMQVGAAGPAAAAAASSATPSAAPTDPAMAGLRALTMGGQGDVLQMLGIPAN